MYKIECPYCENNLEVETDGMEKWEEECPECEERFEVIIEYCEPIFSTRKFNYQTCLECGCVFDKYWDSRAPMPEGYTSQSNLCDSCYFKLTI